MSLEKKEKRYLISDFEDHLMWQAGCFIRDLDKAGYKKKDFKFLDELNKRIIKDIEKFFTELDEEIRKE